MSQDKWRHSRCNIYGIRQSLYTRWSRTRLPNYTKRKQKVFNAEKVCTLLRKIRELCIFATFYTLLTLLFSRHYCKELT